MQETIIVDTKDRKSTISADIYGHFAEHLGRCIYGGFWVGEDSTIPNRNGCNSAVVEAFREIAIPNLRWPGGCFADEYHWKDGIGERSLRKRMVNTNWGGVVEDNSFGTHEFMELCGQLGAKPYICGNVGSGTVQEMDEWIEYLTFSGDSPMASLRAQNGHPEAWRVPLFGVGNESWGCGGSMRAEFYADEYRRYQTFVRQYGEDKILKIACGPSADDYRWTEVLMEAAGNLMDGLSLHYYTITGTWQDKTSATGFTAGQWYKTLSEAMRMEELVRRHDETMSRTDPQKRVGLFVDEWGTWFNVEPGTNPGFLYQQNTMRDAAVAGITLNIFNNHSDRVRGANLAQAVNVLQSPVLTEGRDIVLTPTWHVFRLYRKHHGAVLLGTSVAASPSHSPDGTVVPGLSVSASCPQGGTEKEYFVTAVNTDAERAKTVAVSLSHFDGTVAAAEAEAVCGSSMGAYNSFDEPDAVTLRAIPASVTGRDTVTVEIPAHSVAGITLHA